MARAESGGVIEQISVQLVDAAAGDRVLVHAGVAIARLT
jgi:hydrogenase maturation factor